MKLDLRKIIHVPGASVPFDYEMDLTHLEAWLAWGNPCENPFVKITV